jgi:rod shape-determining protein MreC
MFIPKKQRSIFAAAALLIGALILLTYGFSRPSETGVLRKLVLGVAAPVQHALNVPLEGLGKAWKRYLFLVGLEDENRRLTRENDALSETLNQYREGYLEGLRLRKLLGLREAFPHRTVVARVIDRGRASLFKTLLVDKGTADGLRVGLPVLADRGVVGRVIEASWSASRILLLTDENSNIDALIQQSRAQGILQGAGLKGGHLKYVSRTEEVRPGDTVITSGLAGVFPKGITLGVVKGVSPQEGGLFQKIDVAPAVDFGRLEEVVILTPARDKEGRP